MSDLTVPITSVETASICWWDRDKGFGFAITDGFEDGVCVRWEDSHRVIFPQDGLVTFVFDAMIASEERCGGGLEVRIVFVRTETVNGFMARPWTTEAAFNAAKNRMEAEG